MPLRCCCSTACQRETHPPSCRVFCRPALREVCYRGIRALPQCNDSLSTKLVWYSEVRAAEPSLYASPAQVSPSTVRCSSLRCPHTRTSSPPLAVPHHQPRSSQRRQLMEEGMWRTGTKKEVCWKRGWQSGSSVYLSQPTPCLPCGDPSPHCNGSTAFNGRGRICKQEQVITNAMTVFIDEHGKVRAKMCDCRLLAATVAQ